MWISASFVIPFSRCDRYILWTPLHLPRTMYRSSYIAKFDDQFPKWRLSLILNVKIYFTSSKSIIPSPAAAEWKTLDLRREHLQIRINLELKFIPIAQSLNQNLLNDISSKLHVLINNPCLAGLRIISSVKFKFCCFVQNIRRYGLEGNGKREGMFLAF